MAEQLPPNTWSAQVLTLKGTKTVVYSTVTGDVVGEIKNGKFVQTAKKIPQPTKKKPKTVTVPETARVGGIDNTIASYERDAAYYKSVAEDINKSAIDRANARDKYNSIQGDIAKLQGERQQYSDKQATQTQVQNKQDARAEFEKLKTDYQNLQQKLSALIDPKTDPKANQYQSQMFNIVNQSLDLYKQFSGQATTVENVTKMLAGQTTAKSPATYAYNAPTGATKTTTEALGVTGPTGATGPSTIATKTPTSTSGTTVTATGKASSGGTPTTSTFDAGSFRKAEEATMGAPSGVVVNGVSGPSGNVSPQLSELLKKSEFWYDLPDYIFNTVPGLGDILVKAVAENWDQTKFLAAAKQTKWWQTNSETFRQRVIDKAKYDELRAAGEDVSKTDYGQYISKQTNAVKARAKQIAGVTLDDAQAQLVAEKIYNGNLDGDQLAIDRLITPFISKTTDLYAGSNVSTYGGDALKNYQTLQAIAKANGLTLKDVLPSLSTTTTGGDLEKAVLQGLATGDLDVQRLAQNARMVAAQGQPEYVRNLLNQGYDLEQIYSPYKNVMSNVLELNPDQINLNDPTLRSAINNNGDMNVYDFKKTLRKDPRWQYTENARQDVSNAALSVLRDFGFQG